MHKFININHSICIYYWHRQYNIKIALRDNKIQYKEEITKYHTKKIKNNQEPAR